MTGICGLSRNREGGRNTVASHSKLDMMLTDTFRIACEIFCQDMVHCIFLARLPGLDPSHFPVELPGYETCWEARSAAECLHRLQTLPPQIRVSTAMGMLTSWPDAKVPLFEASGFGMHVLVNGSLRSPTYIMCLKFNWFSIQVFTTSSIRQLKMT